MDELNKQIDKILDQIKRKKSELAPKLEQKKNILREFETIENELIVNCLIEINNSQ